MKRVFICLLLFATLSSGCAITHDFKEAKGIKDAAVINIIENGSTREGFLSAMTGWMDNNGYKYKILPSNSSRDQQGWFLIYDGKWSWDMTIYIYLSKASIRAYKNGVSMGYARYSVSANNLNINPGKWKKAEPVVQQMMDNLFGDKEGA